MFKKIARYLIPIPVLLALAACSVLKLPGASSAAAQSNQPSQQGQQGQFDLANQPLESKLAVGTLALEGTSNAVTADEAKTLAPLWKGVKALSASQTASQDEISALYTQIEGAMTPAQIDAIKNINLNQQEMQALMQKYNIQFPQGNFSRNGTPGAPNISQSQIATLRAERSANGGGGFGRGGGFGGANGFTQRTPQAGRTPGANRGGFRGGFNNIFIDPLITMLDQRAGGASS